MESAYFITATGTPLSEDEKLHAEGLARELEDQWNSGIDGILVAGTMGAMQLLTDETYRRLIRSSVEITRGRGEILIGAGDAGFARTRDRIRLLNEHPIDGVAVLAPYFWSFTQAELIDYYRALADESRAPFYLYDLPQVTGTKLELGTILALSEHPNIRGAKISGDFEFTRRLIDVADDSFRVIVAAPELVDVILRHGVRTHLDGMWAIAPRWTVAIGRCASQGDWDEAARYQQKLTSVRALLKKHGFGAFTALMNARGIPGRFAPRPFAETDQAAREELLALPVVRQLIEENPAEGG